MNQKTKKLTNLAMLCALAFVVMYFIRIPIMPSAAFLKFDAKDVIITVGGFIFGPLSAFAISAVVSLLEMVTVSESGPIGLVMNVISSCAFACTASYIYKKRQTAYGAVMGLGLGCAAMTVVMLFWNYLITPIYMGVSRDVVAGMLVPVILPFNLLKAGLNAAMTMLLYKPIVIGLRRSKMLPPSEGEGSGRVKIGIILLSVFVLATCILFALMLNGVF